MGHADENSPRNSERVRSHFSNLFHMTNSNSCTLNSEVNVYICFCRLAYLHEDIEPKVFHRSLISSNVLLDQQWDPKISDFGLAKLYSPAWGITIMESLGSVSLLPSKTYIYIYV
jgi:serine/threonine protein kinase